MSNGKEATQFQPGQSGNPAGTSKKRRLTAELLRRLEAEPEKVQQLIDVGLERAIAGDFQFFQYVFDRSDGKIGEKVQHGGALKVVVRYADDGPGAGPGGRGEGAGGDPPAAPPGPGPDPGVDG